MINGYLAYREHNYLHDNVDVYLDEFGISLPKYYSPNIPNLNDALFLLGGNLNYRMEYVNNFNIFHHTNNVNPPISIAIKNLWLENKYIYNKIQIGYAFFIYIPKHIVMTNITEMEEFQFITDGVKIKEYQRDHRIFFSDFFGCFNIKNVGYDNLVFNYFELPWTKYHSQNPISFFRGTNVYNDDDKFDYDFSFPYKSLKLNEYY